MNDLNIIENGTLMALRYCNENPDQFVRPYVGAFGPEFFQCMIIPIHTMHTLLTPICNVRQSFVWTGLLDHWT